MPDPLQRKLFGPWSAGPWIHSRETRPRVYAEELSSGTRFRPKDDEHGLAAQLVKQKRIGNKVTKKGMWESFKKAMKKSYNMDDAWLEGRSGSVKNIINAMYHLRNFVSDVKEADEDDIHVGNFIKDISNSLLKTVSKIATRNELHINEGVFKNFFIKAIPEFDENDPNDWNVPRDEFIDDELEREKDRIVAWLT